jgi:type III restriction enzyme
MDTIANSIKQRRCIKEGWDVTNLYTMVPLRAADAPILVEQSIGHRLRLPYGGKRTGDQFVF